MTSEEWDSILNRMIFCFSEMNKISDSWDDKEIEYYRELQKEGLTLFVENFGFLGW